MSTSIDLIALLVAAAILALVFRVAAKTRSRVMRAVLLVSAALMIVLMVWNLATHGGFHAV